VVLKAALELLLPFDLGLEKGDLSLKLAVILEFEFEEQSKNFNRRLSLLGQLFPDLHFAHHQVSESLRLHAGY
jgi:hypothetical protein